MSRWSAARTPRWARWSANSARRACACPTALPSPPGPTATCSTSADAWHAPARRARWPGRASDVDDLARRAQRAREIIHGAALPADLVAQISRRLRAPARRIRRTADAGRAQLGHRRRPAHRQLCRPARDLSEHRGRGPAARRHPPVLRQPVQGPRHQPTAWTTASTTSRSSSRSA